MYVSEVNRRSAIHAAAESKKICDTAVTSRLPTASEIGDFELKIG
jgi:hypothetical protein